MPISRPALEPTPDEQVDEADDEVEEHVGDVDCCTLSVLLLAPPLMPASNAFTAVMATPVVFVAVQ